MKYTIVRLIDGKMHYEETEDIVEWCRAAGVAITGKCTNKNLNAHLQGQPRLDGFAGPMGDEGEIWYTDSASNDILSS